MATALTFSTPIFLHLDVLRQLFQDPIKSSRIRLTLSTLFFAIEFPVSLKNMPHFASKQGWESVFKLIKLPIPYAVCF